MAVNCHEVATNDGGVQSKAIASHSASAYLAMVVTLFIALAAVFLQAWTVQAVPELSINVTAFTPNLDSDWSVVYYRPNDAPLLFGNDATADNGGFRAYAVSSQPPLEQLASKVTGRTKLVTTVYDLGGQDLVLTIAQPTSLLRVFRLTSFDEITSAAHRQLGDWSAICSWKSRSGNQYVYLFGKNQAVQFLLRPEANGNVNIIEVQTFDVHMEVSSCATAHSQSTMFIAAEDLQVFALPLRESTSIPTLEKAGDVDTEISGLAMYVSGEAGEDYLFVSSEDTVAIYDSRNFTLRGTLRFSDIEDIEIKGLAVYQAVSNASASGFISYAIESDLATGLGITALDGVFTKFGLQQNTAFDSRDLYSCTKKSPICDRCSNAGYCAKYGGGCSCFAGHTGAVCKSYTCKDACSGHGTCIGPNKCRCQKGWGGLHCSFALVEPSFETNANGGDGDDPAIWISPASKELSRVITTTKSKEGAGLSVFDLQGHLLQNLPAGKPNNVDMIYGFDIGERKVDLAFAACRSDDTLCLFEMLSNGTLVDIAGGSQPTMDNFTVYGSCTYRSPKTGTQYLFVNEKSSRYLQYELTAKLDGSLNTTLVRDFYAGSGGQVEGCVTDEENSWLVLGEEPSALWRYGAEPDSPDEGFAIARVGDGHLYADAEGVTMVYGKRPDQGFIMVSCQGVSAYNIYRRASPHDYVATFTITESANGKIDAVTNTDGITAVGTSLGGDFPHGLFVTHDDANELPDGSTSAEASFKLVSLEKILGAEAFKSLRLLEDVDEDWDPRK